MSLNRYHNYIDPKAIVFLHKNGIKLTLKRASQGLIHYQYMAAVAFHLGGHGVNRDKGQAREWLERASRGKHAGACFLLGVLISSGEYAAGETDPESLYRTAAAIGHPGALTALGNLITERQVAGEHPPTESELAEACEYYRQCIDYGPAHYFYALHLLNGWGCQVDEPLAIQHLESGEVQKDLDCVWLLANLLEKNEGVTERVRLLFLSVADAGRPEAQHVVGLMTLDGHFGDPDPVQAAAWLKRASFGGHPASRMVLSDMHARGIGVEKSPGLALRYAESAYRDGACSRAEVIKANMIALLHGAVKTPKPEDLSLEMNTAMGFPAP